MRADYQKLHVWQRAMEFAERVYVLTNNLPSQERFGLVSQMRRAAVSVPSNIAEGQGRFSAGEFRQFLSNAMGSVKEVETQIQLCVRLNYFLPAEAEPLLALAAEISRSLNRLASSNLSNHGSFTRAPRQ